MIEKCPCKKHYVKSHISIVFTEINQNSKKKKSCKIEKSELFTQRHDFTNPKFTTFVGYSNQVKKNFSRAWVATKM